MTDKSMPDRNWPNSPMGRYQAVAAGSLIASKSVGDLIISAMQIKDMAQASVVFGALASLICFVGTHLIEKDVAPKGRSLKRGLASLVFGVAAGSGLAFLSERDAQYVAERAAMPRIDAATVIETRPVTIADKYCHPNNRGIEITIEHEGKKMLTMCPR